MIIVLLPAFNEEASLPALMPQLRGSLDALGEPYRVVVCNDGSRDRTPQVLSDLAQAYPVDVITHRINRGLGETSRDLFEHAAAIAAPADVIVRLDCDDTHEPQFIGRMIAKLREGHDVVVASRFAPGGGQLGVTAYRAFISRCANLFMRVFFPIKGLREYTCGFRAYRAEIIQLAVSTYGTNFIQLKGLGFTCTLEKLVKLKLLGARFAEAPFVLRYDKKVGTSKMVSSITTLGYLVMTLMYYWPWGGWRSAARSKRISLAIPND
jgi:dolichol-phosphate mannosyltransferase